MMLYFMTCKFWNVLVFGAVYMLERSVRRSVVPSVVICQLPDFPLRWERHHATWMVYDGIVMSGNLKLPI